MNAAHLFAATPIVPVVVLDDARLAVCLAEILLEAGISAMEITLRTDAALDAIAAAATVPNILVGAGSVRTADQIDAVVAAGGDFAVCPGSTPKLLAKAAAVRMPFLPGAVTATEVLHLLEAGYTLLKFFPAELAGGTAQLKSLSQPLPDARFVPTGGITPDNARGYLELDCVTAIGGSWFVPRNLIAAGDFDQIAKLCRAATALADTQH